MTQDPPLLALRLWMPGRACPLRGADGPTSCLAAPDCPRAACPLRLCPADTLFDRVQVTHDGIQADLHVPDAAHAAEVLDAIEEAGETDLVVWGIPGPHPERPVVVRGALAGLLSAALPHSSLIEPPHLHHVPGGPGGPGRAQCS